MDEKDIQISKLNLDKENLEKKIILLNQTHQKEIKSILDYKNSELNIFKNLLNNQISTKNNAVDGGTFPSLSDNSNFSNINMKNIQLEINKLKKEIESKNSIIKALNQKITKFNNDYNKKLVEIKQNSNEYINQIQEQVEQLIIERDELLRKNENLTRGLNQFNDKVKEVHLLYNKKTQKYQRDILVYKSKIKQYENEIKKIQNNSKINYSEDINDEINDNKNNIIFSNKYERYNKKKFINMNNDNDNINNEKLNEIDSSQKLYLENYKSFLFGLDKQINF